MKRFEERHRIEPDGIVDAETVSALNVPVEQRIRTIELNLERWRWLPDPMPARYFIVNVPDFRLEAIENGKAVMDMRVVVGAPDNKTPIFADEMTHVVFSPYWNVPPGIAQGRNDSEGRERSRLPRAQQHGGRRRLGRGRRSGLRRLVQRRAVCASGSGRAAATRSAA